MKIKEVVLSLLIFLLATTVAFGVGNFTGKWQNSNSALVLSEMVVMDVNSIEMFVYNDGNFAYDNIATKGKIDGLYFPRGTKKTVIYSAGLWIGAKVDGEIRLAQAEYSSEFQPGPMVGGTYEPDWADNRYRCYKVNRGDTDANADYAEWPVADGAPVDENGDPLILGDQMIWSVYNDANSGKHENESAGTAPLGVEVQQTTFAYARSGALGNCIFMKFKFINKGSDTLNNTYVSIWSDPDLGDAGDDLVGCDTFLSLGYCYNSGEDVDYGAAPPAVGFDFFQGPIIPSPGDTAWVSGQAVPDYRNLPMTSFGKYINGEDPRSAEQSYLFMLGYRKDRASGLMIPAVCPITGDTTTFVLAGDPVTDSGWVDSSPADRRFMMSSGPFTMEPGDTQEVVCAVLVGQGSSPLSSITALKQIDEGAQAVFDLNFDIPMPPPAPEIYIRGGDGFIDLAWSNDAVGDIQINEALGQEFHFEGFNLYEGETSVGPWHKFATFDVDNDVGLIYTDVVDAEAGGTQRTIAQKGENTGLEFHRLIERDEITGGMLMDNRPYFFAVTAYSYDVNDTSMFYDPGGNLLGHLVATLESPIVAYEVRPMTHIGAFSEQAKHVSGGSDGTVYIEYIYPDEVTGDEYEVSFNEDLTWNLKNITTGDTLLANQTNQDDNFDYPVQEGIMVRATGLPPGIVDWDWEGSERWLSGVDCGGDFFFGGLMNGPDFFGSNVTATDYVSVEIRFSFTTTQKAVLYTRGADPSYGYTGYYDCPFTVWDVTSSPERQLNVCFVENEGEDSQDSSWLPGATNGGREYLFIMNSDYSETPNPLYTQATIWDVIGDGPDGDCDCLYAMWPSRRGDRDPYEYLQDGQKFIIIASKPNIPADKFRFVTKRATESDGDFIALSLDNIKTVPNPYYAFYEEEVDQFDRMMKFINVPPADMKIRIFNLAGDLVRTMDVTVAEVFAGGGEIYWDLKTDEDMWVASGIYVWLIEADGIGSKFGKMAIFTEVEQLTNF